jgi:subtilisin family serine protease
LKRQSAKKAPICFCNIGVKFSCLSTDILPRQGSCLIIVKALYGEELQMQSRWVALTVLLVGWTVLHGIDRAAASPDRPYKAGELLVQFKSDRPNASRTVLEHSARVQRNLTIGRSRIHRIVLETGASVENALAAYRSDPDVEIAEPNYLMHAQRCPRDTYFNRQWGLSNSGQAINGVAGTTGADLDAQSAWDISTGGDDVVVAVIDTGCDLQHPDLNANIWNNPGEIPDNGIDDDGNHYIDDVHGWDFADGDNDPQDASGHGTHVAGIIGAQGNNAQGVAGMAWHVRIMPVRFMDGFEEGSTADAIAAIEYALANGAKIINCSWGSSSYSQVLRHVMADSGALFVCAAGNNSQDTDMAPFYPASFGETNIISVAASDPDDRLAWFSNYGPASVDVTAPGIGIYSLNTGRRTVWSENFNSGYLDDWTTGGSGDRWTIAYPPAMATGPAMAVSSPENYVNNADTWAIAPVQDLSTASATQLTFQITGQSETNADFLNLEVSTDGSAWYSQPLLMGGFHKTGISGAVPFWMTAKADMGRWDGQPQLYIRLRFKSDASNTQGGYYIDGLQLTAAGSQDSYQYMQGTSMAAGYVSGLAALILSESSDLTSSELKSVIQSSVDLKQTLLDQVASGGRVNAFNALTLLRELSLRATSAADDKIQLTWDTQESLNSQVTIERRTEGQDNFETVALVDAGTHTFADSSLTANSTYYYRIQAETRDGRSGYSNQTLATTLEPGATAATSGGGSSGGCFLTSFLQ